MTMWSIGNPLQLKLNLCKLDRKFRTSFAVGTNFSFDNHGIWVDPKGLMWNVATDATGNPKLPGTTSCGGNGCWAMVNSDGSYSFNQDCEY